MLVSVEKQRRRKHTYGVGRSEGLVWRRQHEPTSIEVAALRRLGKEGDKGE
jgi:hypothetical protein